MGRDGLDVRFNRKWGDDVGGYCGECQQKDARISALEAENSALKTELAKAHKSMPGQGGCYDCGLPYKDPGWVETSIDDKIWARISPSGDEGGILCITCMARRLAALGLDEVHVALVGMEPLRASCDPDRCGFTDRLTVCREENAELECDMEETVLGVEYQIHEQVMRINSLEAENAELKASLEGLLGSIVGDDGAHARRVGYGLAATQAKATIVAALKLEPHLTKAQAEVARLRGALKQIILALDMGINDELVLRSYARKALEGEHGD